MESEKRLEETFQDIPFNSSSEAWMSFLLPFLSVHLVCLNLSSVGGAYCCSQFLSFLSLGFLVHQMGEICVLLPLYGC